MEQHSLQTASAYLNNLLLARGLLRNGKNIDFARPDKASGGTDATMAKVINLVHDLVLRRDREAEQREVLASTIYTLRSNQSQHETEIERIQTTCTEMKRNLSAAEAQERSLKASAKRAEAGAKELKDQMQRMKSTLEQVRSKCQSDVKKRDIELEKLKTHLVNMQRGKRDGTGMNLISIAPRLRDSRPAPDVSNPEYSLEQESNSFLASFVKSLNADLEVLSGEHKWLLYLIRRTKKELEDMMGGGEEEASDLGLNISKQKILPPNCPTTETYEELAKDMTLLLEHCGAILSNPSYVSIEEVEIRENEIVNLRDGWEKMAGRLAEALKMMDTWRKRMIEGGETVNLEELGIGMDLGRSIAGPYLGQSDSGVDAGSSMMYDEENSQMSEHLFGPSVQHDTVDEVEEQDENDEEAEASNSTVSVPVLNVTEEHSELSFEEPQPASPSPQQRQRRRSSININLSAKHLTASPARRGIYLPPPKSVLKETNNNLPRPSPAKRSQLSPRKVSFDDEQVKSSQRQQRHLQRHNSPEIDDLEESDSLPDPDDSMDFDQILAEEAAKAASVTSSLSSTRAPRLSVAEKLALAAAEAQEAEIQQEEEQVPKKRKRSGQTRAQRRRSTLAPEELDELMGCF